jgi:uncharacterized protein YycO
MRLIFSRRRTLSSALIRWFTWSRWSHVSVQVSDTLVIDSRALAGGVHYHPVERLLAESSAHEVVDLPLPDEAAALAWLQEQIGRPYDWSAVLGVLWRSVRWDEPDAWFCSELVEGAIVAGGLSRYRAPPARITPELLWVVR